MMRSLIDNHSSQAAARVMVLALGVGLFAAAWSTDQPPGSRLRENGLARTRAVPRDDRRGLIAGSRGHASFLSRPLPAVEVRPAGGICSALLQPFHGGGLPLVSRGFCKSPGARLAVEHRIRPRPMSLFSGTPALLGSSCSVRAEVSDATGSIAPVDVVAETPMSGAR